LVNDGALSDDSEFAEKTATMIQICESLDSAQIVGICLNLITKSNINANEAVFKITQELSVTFFEKLLINAALFKNKAKVVKEGYVPLLQTISIESCDDLS
jgi:uncharacterized NAD-dependent epimerase/dehydratase family protein